MATTMPSLGYAGCNSGQTTIREYGIYLNATKRRKLAFKLKSDFLFQTVTRESFGNSKCISQFGETSLIHGHLGASSRRAITPVSAIWEYKDDPLASGYCSPENIHSMPKKFKSGGIAHELWIEQPENIPTCLATKPYNKSAVSNYFKKLKPCK
ncbi:hypothetical protein MLD38_018462 [Melastoma candidum]|uniref:Uncharacterized protein n=1 Tax=Melastoma candidum TaxID=119954 RepID=A0ACB9QTT4_9MYRT|nr:hypothetical protein MLD38_018462 [Melastoma candidum]